tara:strand:- start:2305 stop:2613 length:309 start_codon:yes stop_codon:yes gene_type:complete
MKNLLLIITLLASTSLLSQTSEINSLVVSDLLYSKGVESAWDVLYNPSNPEAPIEHLDKGDGWDLNARFGGRTFVLYATKPGIYMVTQEFDGITIQIVSVGI